MPWIKENTNISILVEPSEDWIRENQKQPTIEEKKDRLRPLRNQLLNDVDIVYCNALNLETMSEEQKTAWREYKQKLKDWIDVDLDAGTFPNKPTL